LSAYAGETADWRLKTGLRQGLGAARRRGLRVRCGPGVPRALGCFRGAANATRNAGVPGASQRIRAAERWLFARM